jgi:hypothetical protein
VKVRVWDDEKGWVLKDDGKPTPREPWLRVVLYWVAAILVVLYVLSSVGGDGAPSNEYRCQEHIDVCLGEP